jgi:hypothetical protein
MGAMRGGGLLLAMGLMVCAGCGSSSSEGPGSTDGSTADHAVIDSGVDSAVHDSSGGDSTAPAESGVDGGGSVDGSDGAAGPAMWDISSWDNATWN